MFIEAISKFIPDSFISLNELCNRVGVSSQIKQIFSRYHGIEKLPYAGNISYPQLLENAISPLLKSIDKKKIKYLVYASVNPAWPFGHSTIANLQENLGLYDTQIFSVNIHECTTTITAFEILSALMMDKDEDVQAILLTGDIEMNPSRGLPRVPLTGDASAAVRLSNVKGDHRYVAGHVSSNSKYAKGIWRTDIEESAYQKEFFKMVNQNLSECLKKANLDLNEVKCLLPVNSSVAALTILAKQLGFSPERVFTKNIPKMGHCFGADVIFNLESAISEKILSKGDFYMMFLIGQSGSFGTAIFQY